MAEHDPMEFANGLGSKLSSGSRHVCVFLGAGASKACGLPDVSELETAVLAGLAGPQDEQFKSQLEGRNLEFALSRLRRIAALLSRDTDEVDGLTAAGAAELDRAVCEQIVNHLRVDADLAAMLKFASWAGRSTYRLPVEIFSVNYDLLLESALEELGVAYFDGFVGTLRGRFRQDLVEASPDEADSWLPSFIVRVWKLHGSINWVFEGKDPGEVSRASQPDAERAAAIYPSDSKYEESRRVPFVVLHDRFRRALYDPETLVLVTGYSFRDQDLNELLLEAATRRPRSETMVLCHGELPVLLRERALTTPNLQAIGPREAVIGGVEGGWKHDGDIADVWRDDEMQLGDFSVLASFLARSSPPQPELDIRLSEVLAANG